MYKTNHCIFDMTAITKGCPDVDENLCNIKTDCEQLFSCFEDLPNPYADQDQECAIAYLTMRFLIDHTTDIYKNPTFPGRAHVKTSDPHWKMNLLCDLLQSEFADKQFSNKVAQYKERLWKMYHVEYPV